MFNHGFANSLQQQQQQQQGQQGQMSNNNNGNSTANNVGAGGPGSGFGGFDLQQLMAMSGMSGGGGAGMNNAFMGLGGGGQQGGASGAAGVPGMMNANMGNQQIPQQGQMANSGGQDATFAAMAHANPNLMLNPQIQAFLQQQMQQQQQRQQTPQSSAFPQQQQQQQIGMPNQQNIRWPGMAGMGQPQGQGQQAQQQVPPNMQQMFMGQQPHQQNLNGLTMNPQAFNPFAQQQQHMQQGQQGMTPQGAPNMAPNFFTPNMLNAMQSQLLQAQQQKQQQQPPNSNQQGQQQQQQIGGMDFDPAALMAAAAQASGGMIDPTVLLQNAGLLSGLHGLGAGQNNTGVNGHNSPAMMQQQQQQQPVSAPTPKSAPMRAPTPVGSAARAGAHQSPKPRHSSSTTGTPEVKSKPPRKSGGKKKKDEEQAQQSQQRRPASSTGTGAQHVQGSFDQSHSQTAFQTPTQSHASIPLASPAQAFAQQQERDRSQTRSPSVSGAPSSAQRPTFMPPGTNGPAGSSTPTGWAPSLTPQRQQQLLHQALNFSKAQSAQGSGSGAQGQQPTPSPAQTLMQMGYVYVKSNVLPNNGFGAGIPGSGPSGAGAVLSIDEAKTIGIFGPQQQQLLGQAQSQQARQGIVPPQLGQSHAPQHLPPQKPSVGPSMHQQNASMGHMLSQAQTGMPSPQGVPLPGQTPAQAQMHAHGIMPSTGPSHLSHVPPGAQGGAVGAQAPYLQHAGYRGSPLGMTAGSPVPPATLPPASPASAMGGASSPAIKGGARQRQASASSRPASSSGRANHEAQMAAASYAPFSQPTHAGPAGVMPSSFPQSRSGSMSGTQQPSSPFAAPPPPGPAGVLTNAGMHHPAPNLPPVNGGALPKKTKLGFDIVPEYNARITPLPDSNALSPNGTHRPLAELWKPMEKDEEKELIEIMRKDNEYTKLINSYAGRTQNEVFRRINGLRPIGRLHWWERSADEENRPLSKMGPYHDFKILLPADKRNQRAAMGVRSALNGALNSRGIRLECKDAAQLDENLVPIRLEIDHEGWKLRDTFTWPAPESHKNELLERFAIMLCDDFGLPAVHFAQAIRESIVAQVQDHTSAEAIRPIPSKRKKDEALGRGRIGKQEAKWWAGWRRRLELGLDNVGSIREMEEGEGEEEEEEEQSDETQDGTANGHAVKASAELRIQIRLDITVGAMNLIDQFEWDVSDEGSSAEDFATAFAADLGLSGEFRTAIAHSIREQVDVYIRSLALLGYAFDGGEVYDEELRSVLLAPLSNIVRIEGDVDAHTPKLMQLTELEILQQEKEREREARRKRRQTRGRRGVNLPDREPLKTARTAAVHGLQQNVLAGTDSVGAGLGDNVVGREATSMRSAAAGGMSTRRAAAVMANANIASASAAGEYGTPTPQPEDLRANGLNVVQRDAVKRRRLDSHNTHFEYPGGLGKIDDDDADDERDGGPKFAPTNDDGAHSEQRAAAELGGVGVSGAAAAAKASRHGLSGIAHAAAASSSGGGAVAWNMARPEEALNQVANWHDGMWYCSNCGVPGTLDPSRRKGPLGDKTLCGMCGKYFHRHRKARPVEYTRSVHHHLKQLQSRGITPNMVEVEDLLAKERSAEAKRLGLPTSASEDPVIKARPPPLTDNVVTNDGVSEPGVTTDLTSTNDTMMATSSASEVQQDDVKIPTQPAATASGQTLSETSVLETAPPAQVQVKEERGSGSFPATRGNSPDLPFEQVGSPDDSDSSGDDEEENKDDGDAMHVDGSPPKSTSQPPLRAKSTPGRSESPLKGTPGLGGTALLPGSSSVGGSTALAYGSPAPPPTSTTTTAASSASASPPNWLAEASRALRTKYPLDRFEIIPRPRPVGVAPPAVSEWRVRCQDCPGKLYTPGPEETLANFEIHLRNRAHRANVQKAAQQENRKPHEALS